MNHAFLLAHRNIGCDDASLCLLQEGLHGDKPEHSAKGLGVLPNGQACTQSDSLSRDF